MCAGKVLEGDMWKLIGNSGYGKQIEDKLRHEKTIYTDNDSTLYLNVCSPKFKSFRKIGDVYEIDCKGGNKKMDRAYQVGIAVYQLSKLVMLKFYYNFLQKNIKR